MTGFCKSMFCKFMLCATLSLFIVSRVTAAQSSESQSPELQSPNLQASVGAVCDSQAQAERLIKLAGEVESPREALNQVNDEAGKKDACVVAPVYYVPGNKVSRISNGLGTFEVVEVFVVAVETARGPAALSEPVTWFAIFTADDQDV
jgi:hypothetical protein